MSVYPGPRSPQGERAAEIAFPLAGLVQTAGLLFSALTAGASVETACEYAGELVRLAGLVETAARAAGETAD